ncbi:Hypothetical protein FKW44_016826 [Caligus rogercresseyi]|uniref:Uncharacterized protein n=1 Tax=Caligus rogercresseyi TaxID=217165 RepID=A0A7T8H299_CALRO|nr:Hypothetical protein FKW44_016826 [Caligus rogercresseyi]
MVVIGKINHILKCTPVVEKWKRKWMEEGRIGNDRPWTTLGCHGVDMDEKSPVRRVPLDRVL